MRAQHTPGPFTAGVYKVTSSMLERLAVGSVHHAVCQDNDSSSSTGLLLALCGDEPGLDSQSAADARLFSAAPEMLSLLKRFMALPADIFDLNAENHLELANLSTEAAAAIEKAEGRKS